MKMNGQPCLSLTGWCSEFKNSDRKETEWNFIDENECSTSFNWTKLEPFIELYWFSNWCDLITVSNWRWFIELLKQKVLEYNAINK